MPYALINKIKNSGHQITTGTISVSLNYDAYVSSCTKYLANGKYSFLITDHSLNEKNNDGLKV